MEKLLQELVYYFRSNITVRGQFRYPIVHFLTEISIENL